MRRYAMMPLSLLSLVVLVGMGRTVDAGAFVGVVPTGRASIVAQVRSGAARRDTALFGSLLRDALKRPSKMLTVGVEYAPRDVDDARASDPDGGISVLSMQLRRAKVTAIYCSDPADVATFVAEQETARGNFPGPCPVIYSGAAEGLRQAIEAGANGVVLDTDEDGGIRDEEEVDVVWRVTDVGKLADFVETSGRPCDAVLLENPTADEVAQAVAILPKTSVVVASVASMQPDEGEVSAGKTLKAAGCGSILAKRACVGDDEDLEYAKFLVDSLTSKASSEFKFSGLTGSTNGHFGGVQANGKRSWRRYRAMEVA